MEDIKVLGIDLAKNIFQLCGLNKRGEKVFEKRVKREELTLSVLQSGAEEVAMEACSSSHHWGRQFIEQGKQVILLAPQNVKPFVRRQKTDARDAEAIAVCSQQSHIPHVKVKSLEQQNLQFMHRIRSRLIRQRTMLINEIRGFLSEEGQVLSAGRQKFERWLKQDRLMNAGAPTALSEHIEDMWEEYRSLNERIRSYEKRIKEYSRQSESCERLMKIEGIGVLSATAIVAAVGTSAEGFKDAKHFSAWLGLTPRQHSSGNRELVLGISKKGDRYIRELLIHGARNVVRWSQIKHKQGQLNHPRKQWIIKKLAENKHPNKVSVAYARKNARIVWKLLSTGESYKYAA